MSAEQARRIWNEAQQRRRGVWDPLPPELMPVDDDPWRPEEGYPPADFGPGDPINQPPKDAA